MHLFLKLHTLAQARGDGLRPEWVDLLLAATSADDSARAPVQMSVVQTDAYRPNTTTPPLDGSQPGQDPNLKATG